MNLRCERLLTIPSSVVDAVCCQTTINESPHNLYKYPARFAPSFAREVIRAFSGEGDVVLDPFCGGGTTLIEAMGLGRRAAGTDISGLATFIARAKSTPISIHDRREITSWCDNVESLRPFGMDEIGRVSVKYREHYERNLPSEIKQFFCWIIAKIESLRGARQQAFARLILLAVGQRALDCKTNIPGIITLQEEYFARLRAAIGSHTHFMGEIAVANCMQKSRLASLRRIINCDAEEIATDRRIPRSWLPAKLVVTSPPYPGVHVVYHRWQINGRKETAAPFWLANQQDGAGESYYGLGRRNEIGLDTYFHRLRKIFSAVHSMLSADAYVFQLVAFADPRWQLPKFLDAMEAAGFSEQLVRAEHASVVNGRVWRQVPGRKWYANRRGETSASKEVMLVHRASHY